MLVELAEVGVAREQAVALLDDLGREDVGVAVDQGGAMGVDPAPWPPSTALAREVSGGEALYSAWCGPATTWQAAV